MPTRSRQNIPAGTTTGGGVHGRNLQNIFKQSFECPSFKQQLHVVIECGKYKSECVD